MFFGKALSYISTFNERTDQLIRHDARCIIIVKIYQVFSKWTLYQEILT